MSVLNNSIAYAQFRSRGGWTSLGIICGAYAALIGGIMFLTVRANPRDVAGTMEGWTAALAVIHTLILLLFGSTRVSGAIRQDLTGRMIESNRLMPVSSTEAVVGYLFGAPSQAIGLAVTSVLLGCISSGCAGIDVTEWLMLNVFLAMGVLATWIVTAFGAFLMRGAPFIVGIPVMAVLMSDGEILRMVPGLALLMTPLQPLLSHGGPFGGKPDIRPVDLAGIAALGALSTIFFLGAARRYRRSDIAALGPVLGLLLLAVWIGMSIFGMLNWQDIGLNRYRYYGRDAEVNLQILGTLLACLLLSIIPVGSSTMDAVRWKRTNPEDRADLRRPGPAALVALMAATFTSSIGMVIPDPMIFMQSMAPSYIAILLALLTLGMIVRFVAGISSRTLVLPMLWVILAWVIPLIADLILQSFNTGAEQTLGLVGTISPAGTIIASWGDFTTRPDVRAGLVIQGCILAASIMAAMAQPRPVHSADHPSPGSN